VRRAGGNGLAALFSRYTAGSVVAFTTSELVLILCYGSGLVGAAPASIVAFCCGAIPNYVLNRAWVWKRRGRVDLRSELLPYALISLAALAMTALVTSLAAGIAPGGHTAKTVFVATAYVVTIGVLFLARFAAYHWLIFRDGAVGSPRSFSARPVTMPSRGSKETDTT
jgi:putative flippase GtrA